MSSQSSGAQAPGPSPVLDPNIGNDLQAYLVAQAYLNEMRNKLLAMAAELKHMKNVMYGVVMVMNQFQEVSGAKVRVFSAVENLASDMRSEASGGEGAMNGIFDGGSSTQKNTDGNGNLSLEKSGLGKDKKPDSIGPPSKDKPVRLKPPKPNQNQIDEAKKLYEELQQLQAFLDYEKSLGKNSVIDANTIQNLQDAITQIKSTFGSSWGDFKKMAQELINWSFESRAGVFSPELKQLQFNFQQLDQGTSAFSTTTNTRLQFEAEQFKQFLGIDETSMQSYQKWDASMIQNQRSN